MPARVDGAITVSHGQQLPAPVVLEGASREPWWP